MGRLVSRIPNNDPDRLQRILDAKSRLIGVGRPDDAPRGRGPCAWIDGRGTLGPQQRYEHPARCGAAQVDKQAIDKQVEEKKAKHAEAQEEER
jgi:hypothetical protein